MTDTKWVRWAAVAGVVFFVLILVSGPILLGSGPTLTDSASKVFSYFVNHQSSLKASAALWGLAMSAALVWAAALFSALRKAEGGRAGLAVAALGGVILATAMQVVALAAQATATLRTHELGASGVRVLFTFETLANGGILFGLLVAVGAAGVVSLKTGLFGRWFGAVSVLLAVASGAGAFSIAYAKLENLQSIILPLDGLWILVVSIMLLVQPEKALASPVEPVRP